MSNTMLIRSYGLATRLLGPLTPSWIARRAKDGKEDPERQGERHGEASVDRPDGPLIWMHAISVGESQMLFPLIERFLDHNPDLHILFTTGTVTSAGVIASRLPERTIHQYIPLDYPAAVTAFLDHWHPDMAMWTESEIWPNLIRSTKARNIPMALINARMSAKSIEGWSGKARKSGQVLFGMFDIILAANQETANGLGGLVGREIEISGNLKDAAAPLPVNDTELKDLRAQIYDRPVWCAASTHDGEEDIILDAHIQVLKTHPSACLILAPRHPNRSNEIQSLMDARGIRYKCRSKNEALSSDIQVYLFDTIGEMGLAYRASHLSFVCGSLLKEFAGHNPLEPARLGNAVLTGVYVSSFADTYMSMFTFNAARRVLNPNDIGLTVTELFSSPDLLFELQSKAQAFADSRDAVLDYVWEQLTPIMPDKIHAAA